MGGGGGGGHGVNGSSWWIDWSAGCLAPNHVIARSEFEVHREIFKE